MTWNYRVMRFESIEGLAALTVDEDYYGIVEVHYASDGRLSAYMGTPVRMQWGEEGHGPNGDACVYFNGRFAYRIDRPNDLFRTDVLEYRMSKVAGAAALYEAKA